MGMVEHATMLILTTTLTFIFGLLTAIKYRKIWTKNAVEQRVIDKNKDFQLFGTLIKKF